MITGSQFIEHLYSQGYCVEEQREFGISDFGKRLKKLIPKDKINKARDFIEDKYANSPLGKWEMDRKERSINKSFRRRGELTRDISEEDGQEIFQNSKLEEKLIQRKPKGSIIVKTDKYSNKNIDISSPENKRKLLEHNQYLPESKEELDEINKASDLIVYNKTEGGFSSLAHELGHVSNRRSLGRLSKIENKGNSVASKIGKAIDNNHLDKATSGGKERRKEVKSLIRSEKNASKTGLKLLKESGANRKELKASKKQLDKALRHYKEGGNIYKKTPRLNKLKLLRKKDDIEIGLDLTNL